MNLHIKILLKIKYLGLKFIRCKHAKINNKQTNCDKPQCKKNKITRIPKKFKQFHKKNIPMSNINKIFNIKTPMQKKI